MDENRFIARRAHLLAEDIANQHLVPVHEVFGKCREAHIVKARHHLIVELYRAGLSTPSIGKIVNKDHSTVIAALKKNLGADYVPNLHKARGLELIRYRVA